MWGLTGKALQTFKDNQREFNKRHSKILDILDEDPKDLHERAEILLKETTEKLIKSMEETRMKYISEDHCDCVVCQDQRLRDKIGDLYFSIGAEDYQNEHYPEVVDIWDCEYETLISITGEGNVLEMADALVKLLNGERKYNDNTTT